MTRTKVKTPGARAGFEVVLAGDRRLAEEVILEVRALAQRYGLAVPSARVVSRSAPARKTKKPRRGA